MASSKELKENINQHIAKNTESQIDDKIAKIAMQRVIECLKQWFPSIKFIWHSKVSLIDVGTYIGKEIHANFQTNASMPDGGVIWANGHPLVIVEMKRQGTNKDRVQEGKKQQAIGNAIERLGKNLTLYRLLFKNEKIFPFITFCHGCDFTVPYTQSKLYVLNNLCDINKEYYGYNEDQPFTCIAREKPYTLDELTYYILKMAISSLNYYMQEAV